MLKMDWNTKSVWENLVNSKTSKTQEFEGGIIGTGSFRLYEGKNSSSGSEPAPGSSARSSISVCLDSSFKEKNTLVAFGNNNAFSKDIVENEILGSAELDESPSVGSGESLIGLKLGKRMYFENNSLGSNDKTVPIASNVKKMKSSDSNSPRCQVDDCNLDLSTAKEYHRKHKVCESHSKSPKVVIGGLERRFCQQCSRFHNLSEFDEKKRSCRRRLSDHNVRRRKPQLDSMMRLPSPFSAFTCTDVRPQQMSFSSNVPHVYPKHSSNSTWVSSFRSKVATKNGCMLNFGETGGSDEQLQLPGTDLPHGLRFPGHSFNKLLPLSKGTKSKASTQELKESVQPQNLESAPDFHRALSLLSNDSWSSFQQPNNSLDHSVSINRMNHLPLMQGFPQSFPLGSSEFCQTDNHSSNSFAATANDNVQFQPFKVPYESVLFSNLFN